MNTQNFNQLIDGEPAEWHPVTSNDPLTYGASEPVPGKIARKIKRYVDRQKAKGKSESAIKAAVAEKFNIRVTDTL